MSSLLVQVRGAVSNSAGSISNQNYFQNNCNKDPGIAWAKAVSTYMQNPKWQAAAPWLENFCDKESITWNGKTTPCNPGNVEYVNPITGQVDPLPFPDAYTSGKCSGYATENDVQVIMINQGAGTSFFYDGNYTDEANVTHALTLSHTYDMNSMRAFKYSDSALDSNKYRRCDWGIDNPDSPVYADFDNFISCPLSAVGIQIQDPFSLSGSTFNSMIVGAHVHTILHQSLPNSVGGQVLPTDLRKNSTMASVVDSNGRNLVPTPHFVKRRQARSCWWSHAKNRCMCKHTFKIGS